MKLTKTQEAIMEVIGDEFESPMDIGIRAGIDNSGGTAASLRVLLRKGLVEQTSFGRHCGWELFGYRKARRPAIPFPEIVRMEWDPACPDAVIIKPRK
jgi:hypothetical protein